MSKLFESYKPTTYKLAAALNQKTNNFEIKLTILGKKVGKPSHRITLHQKNLAITSVTVRKFGKKDSVQEVSLQRFNKRKKIDELRVHSDSVLYPGSYELAINYVLPADDKTKQRLLGLNSSADSPDRRSLLPCIDEPEAWKNAKIELDLKP